MTLTVLYSLKLDTYATVAIDRPIPEGWQRVGVAKTEAEARKIAARVRRVADMIKARQEAETVRITRNYVAEGLGETIDHCPSDNG